VTRLALAGFGLLAAILCGIILIELAHGRRQPDFAPRHNLQYLSTATAAGASEDSDLANSWVAAILARPLFEPSRRPPAHLSSKESPAGIPRLAGIIITATERAAIFARPDGERATVVGVGERLNGFLVQSIDAGGVVVLGPEGPRILQPSFNPAAPRPIGTATTPIAPVTPLPSQTPSPFASIRGLTGRPLGLAANPDQDHPAAGGQPGTAPSLPAPARTGGSP
jgi:hypothetical protein